MNDDIPPLEIEYIEKAHIEYFKSINNAISIIDKEYKNNDYDLVYCCERNYYNIASLLIDRGANINCWVVNH